MSLTYNSFVTDLANMFPVPTTDPGYVTALPNIIDDMEQRLYRELNLLQTQSRDSSSAFTAGVRTFNIPTPAAGYFVVTQEVNVITPAGQSDPESGTRNPLLPISNEGLNALWPSVTGSTVPVYFSMLDQNRIIVGPWPDAAYQVEVVGEIRPNALSSTNTTTVLSVYFPDLMMVAAMVYGCGYQKNFGAMSDDPKSAVAWEAHLQTLLKSVDMEENRKQFFAEGWSSEKPSNIATPPRT